MPLSCCVVGGFTTIGVIVPDRDILRIVHTFPGEDLAIIYILPDASGLLVIGGRLPNCTPTIYPLMLIEV
jgi:hypothetical protein